METLGRGVIAIKSEPQKIVVSWRVLGPDPEALAFNLYRSADGAVPEKLNPAPLTGATHFTDATFNPAATNTYSVRALLAGAEQPPSARSVAATIPANAPARPYFSIPLQTPVGYTPNDTSVGDLDGDGEYEIIVHMTGRARDNSRAGITDEPIFHAYKLDGTLLWSINLGKNIREGAHYTQFLVYDFDGDGRAELICKTGDGTVDGIGKVIGDAKADYRTQGEDLVPSRDKSGSVTTPDGKRMASRAGYVLAGPEFLTVFDGRTGAALATADYVPARGDVNAWGDGYGNRVDRFLAGVAYLDGVRPSAGSSTATNTAPPTTPTPTAAREITTSPSPTSMATAATRSFTAPCASMPTARHVTRPNSATVTPSTFPTSTPPDPASRSSPSTRIPSTPTASNFATPTPARSFGANPAAPLPPPMSAAASRSTSIPATPATKSGPPYPASTTPGAKPSPPRNPTRLTSPSGGTATSFANF
jgi:hypothetical protein